jgi:hypothetical protein
MQGKTKTTGYSKKNIEFSPNLNLIFTLAGQIAKMTRNYFWNGFYFYFFFKRGTGLL